MYRDYIFYNTTTHKGEGWALYTESLGKEMGLYTNPYHQLGSLGMEMHRAFAWW